METHFWESRWELNDIGFHKQQVHTYLIRHYAALNLGCGDTIFVPLCGKSRDINWLRQQQLQVIGSELSQIAIEAFFKENGLQASLEPGFPHHLYRTDGITLLHGNHFAIEKSNLKGVKAVYDRAGLVALPPDLRRRYASQLCRLLPVGTRMLLISYDYDQRETEGPPFAAPFAEIVELFSPDFTIDLLEQNPALDIHQGLKARGVTQLDEFACLLIRS